MTCKPGQHDISCISQGRFGDGVVEELLQQLQPLLQLLITMLSRRINYRRYYRTLLAFGDQDDKQDKIANGME